ncbi:MAG: hypothetical protein WD847_05490 [Pirellulales bacterium]
MNRFFVPLAIATIACLLATLVLGLWLASWDIRDPADRAAQSWATMHRLAGIATGLLVVLTNSIVMTYFIGTSRWCREVVETYSLSIDLARTSNRLKRQAFPYAVAGMLMIVVMVALGGAADPGGSVRSYGIAGLSWTNWHLAASIAGSLLIGFGFVRQWQAIHEHHLVISGILSEVARVREQRGLTS